MISIPGRALALLLALLTAACAPTSRELSEARRLHPELGYYRGGEAARRPGEEAALPGRYVVLAFSGGGTRAAALAQGVLLELEATPSPGRRDFTLLDAVDMISSTSGGSVAAANFVLHGRRGYRDLEGRFLRYDGFDRLVGDVINPVRVLYNAATEASRIEQLSEMLAERIFGNARYADLAARWPVGRPLLVLNAADVGSGERLSFTQSEMSLLCLNLNEVRLADAVTASAAFPVALSPLPLPDHSPCDAQRTTEGARDSVEPLLLTAGLTRPDLAVLCAGGPPLGPTGRDPLRSRALRLLPLLNLDPCGRDLPRGHPDRILRAHLLDGGIADNLGLAVPLETLTAGGADPRVRRAMNRGAVREVIVIAVNARSQSARHAGRGTTATPSWITSLSTTIGAAIDGRSGGLVAQLDTLGPMIRGGYADTRGCPPDGSGPPGRCPPRVRVIGVDFESIPEAECRSRFQAIGTSWTNREAEITALQEVAGGLLRMNQEYLDLVGGDWRDGLRRVTAACATLAGG